MNTPSARRSAAPAFPARRSLALLAGLVAAGPALSADRPVELRFEGHFAGEPFDCTTTYDGVGATGARIDVTDYRLFVSSAALVTEGGTEVPIALEVDDVWQADGVALLDFENGAGRCDNGTPETNATLRGTVPDRDDYAGVAFDLGVPFEANHGDPTLRGSPLNLTAMFWNWQGGYRFMKLDTAAAVPAMTGEGAGAVSDHGGDTMRHGEGHGEGHGERHGGGHGAAAGAWMLHVGSAGCASASRTSAPASANDCAAPNRARVALDGFDAATDRIVVDPARALADSDLTSNAPDTAPGCMSGPDDPDCASVLPLLGLSHGDVPADEQRLFSVRGDAP